MALESAPLATVEVSVQPYQSSLTAGIGNAKGLPSIDQPEASPVAQPLSIILVKSPMVRWFALTALAAIWLALTAPTAILPAVILPASIFSAVIAPAAILADVMAPASILLVVTALVASLLAVMALSHLLESVEPGLTGVEIDRDALEAQVGNLLKAQPTIILDPLRWRTDKGESRAAFSADLFLPQEEDALDFDDFGLHYLRQAQLSLDVSRAMVLHVAGLVQKNANPISRAVFVVLFEQYANRLQRAGLVQIDGDTVSLRASYRGEDESIELNGERMSLDELMVRIVQLIQG